MVAAGAAIVVESAGMAVVFVVVLVLVLDEAPTSPAAVPPAGGVSLFLQAPTAKRVANAVSAEIALMRICFSFRL
jgi:hypothetical protein